MSKAPKTDTWMPLFVADYQAKTSRLTLAQHGAYLLLIFDYWKNGAPPDDDAVIARILGVEKREWQKLRPAIEPFFETEGGAWVNGRVERELSSAGERKLKAEEKARKAAAGRWGNRSPEQCLEDATSIPQALHEECPLPSPSPVRLFPERVEKPQLSVSVQAAQPKGCRLKPDWQPSADNYAFAVSEGFTAAQVDRIAEDFHDFWTAKSGKDAVKLDWTATWRRWVRNTDRKIVARTTAAKRVAFV